MFFKKNKKVKSNFKVSVIVPNYNYGKYLKKRIESIINQKFPIYEIIILDDCSKDNSLEVIKKCKFKSNDVKIITNEKNSGSVFAQWQKGLSYASGDLIWIAEADDLSDSKFLQKLVPLFDDNDIVLAYSDSKIMNENSEIIGKSYSQHASVFGNNRYTQDYINEGNDEIKNFLVVKNYIFNVSSVIFRNSNYNSILDKCKEFKVAGDWFFYTQIIQNRKIAYIAEPLNIHRRHTNSVTTTLNAQRHYDEIVMVQEEVFKKYDISVEVKKTIDAIREEIKKHLKIN